MSKQFSTTLPDELFEKLSREAKRSECSVSNQARAIIAAYYRQPEMKRRDFIFTIEEINGIEG